MHERQLGRQIAKSAHAAVLALNAALGQKKERVPPGPRIIRGRKRGRSWAIRGPQELGGQRWLDCYVPAGGDHHNEEPPVYSVQERPADADLLEELDILDADPLELDTGEEVVFSDSDTLPLYVLEHKNRMRLRGMAQRIETHNQFLPFSLQQFSQGELKDLFAALEDPATDRKSGTEKILVATMFATSSWFERAQNLEIVTSETEMIRGESELLFFNRGTQTWLIPAMSPEYRTSTNEQAEASSREVRCDFIEVPDCFDFSRLVERVANNSVSDGLVFKRKKNLRVRSQRFLLSISARHTLERVERYLLYRTAGTTEPVQASFLFSNPIKAGAARAFYTSLPTAHYRQLYSSICGDVHDVLERTSTFRKTTTVEHEECIGARYCPTVKAQRSFIQAVSSEVEKWRAEIGLQSNAWVEFHNWYTVFCCISQASLIGARGIRDPLLSPSQINQLGVATFRDKDSADQFHTRSIQLSPLAMRTTRYYERHRKRTLQRLALIDSESFTYLNTPDAPWAFFLNPDGRVARVRPSTLHPYLSQVSHLPFNSSRKYLRTRMLELGVDPVAIDSLLGHSAFGEQAWGHFSSLNWREIYLEQSRALDKIVAEIGLKLIPGLRS